MKSAGSPEIEIKLRVADLTALRRRLARLGVRPERNGRVHEDNLLFDTPQGGLAKHGQLLRLRVEGPLKKRGAPREASNPRALLTYKGPAEPASGMDQPKRYKVRQEIEAVVVDPASLRAILEALGLRGWFRYEKFRTHYRLPARFRWAAGLHLVLDETPIGNFIELEGPPQAIDGAAELLGYGPGDYITQNYLSLYLAECRKQGIEPSHMVFAVEKK